MVLLVFSVALVVAGATLALYGHRQLLAASDRHVDALRLYDQATSLVKAVDKLVDAAIAMREDADAKYDDATGVMKDAIARIEDWTTS